MSQMLWLVITWRDYPKLTTIQTPREQIGVRRVVVRAGGVVEAAVVMKRKP
jgi:hypothetical protein